MSAFFDCSQPVATCGWAADFMKPDDVQMRGRGMFSSAFNRLRNALPSTDSNAAPLFQGENHAVLLVNGRPANANFMGPGTRIVERIKRGDNPRTLSDKVAQTHDLRYQLGVPEREADERMLSKLAQIKATSGDNPLNILAGELPIKGKIAAENRGILKKGLFSAKKDPMTTEEEQLLRNKLHSLEQEGFGINGIHEAAEPPGTIHLPTKRTRKRKQPLPGEELLTRLTTRTNKRRMNGAGIGQRGSGISADPFAGPWMQGSWENAISTAKSNQDGGGIGYEPFAGSWMQGEWENAMAGSGKESKKKIPIKGVSSDPFGGPWMQEQWQQAGGAKSGFTVASYKKKKKKKKKVAITLPPEEIELPEDEKFAGEPFGFDPFLLQAPEFNPEELGRFARSRARRSTPAPRARSPSIDIPPGEEPPEEPQRSRSRHRSRSRNRGRRHPYPDIGVDYNVRAMEEGIPAFQQAYDDSIDYLKRKRKDSKDVRRWKARHEHRYQDFGGNTPWGDNLPVGETRTTQGYRPVGDYYKVEPSEGKQRRNRARVLRGDEKKAWDEYDGNEKRQILRNHFGGPPPGKRSEFAARMLKGKMNRRRRYPWLDRFKNELNELVIPMFLRIIDSEGDEPHNPALIASAFEDAIRSYHNRWSHFSWNDDDPTGKHLTVRQVVETRMPRPREDLDEGIPGPAYQEEKEPEGAVYDLVGREGEGLHLAGGSLKLAGQGLSLAGAGGKYLHKQLTGHIARHAHLHATTPSGSIKPLAHIGAHHVAKTVFAVMKGRGFEFTPNAMENFKAYLIPHFEDRVQDYVDGIAHQTGSGFWQKFIDGFKKYGIPILRVASKIVPLLI